MHQKWSNNGYPYEQTKIFSHVEFSVHRLKMTIGLPETYSATQEGKDLPLYRKNMLNKWFGPFDYYLQHELKGITNHVWCCAALTSTYRSVTSHDVSRLGLFQAVAKYCRKETVKLVRRVNLTYLNQIYTGYFHDDAKRIHKYKNKC